MAMARVALLLLLERESEARREVRCMGEQGAVQTALRHGRSAATNHGHRWRGATLRRRLEQGGRAWPGTGAWAWVEWAVYPLRYWLGR
jgi:hypothetical protein